MGVQPGFFDLDRRYSELSETGDPLERLSAVVDFEMFRPELDRVLARSDRSKGGRPPMDAVLMFKVLVLQALFGMSDEQAEFQIRDRLTFMRFLGLGDRVPDYSTIWRFREALVAAGAVDELFARFDAELKARGYFALGGQVIDASIVEAPKQRVSEDEKARIKAGGTAPEIWPDHPAKAAHKDTSARWTVKRGRKKPKPGRKTMERTAEGLMIPVYGYKNHVNVDRRYRLIRRWTVSHAAAHDGSRLPELLNPDAFADGVWADTAYRSQANEAAIRKAGRRSMVHFKKPKGRSMPGAHQRANRARSKVRSSVEHVFAEQKSRMGLFVRTIGIARAKAKIGLANLAYNMRRLIWLKSNPVPA